MPPKKSALVQDAQPDETVDDVIPIEPLSGDLVQIGGYVKTPELLGEGTYGNVYRGCVKADPTQQVAIKVLKKGRGGKQEVMEEVRILRDLKVEASEYLVNFLADRAKKPPGILVYLIFDIYPLNFGQYLDNCLGLGDELTEDDIHQFALHLSEGYNVLRKNKIIHNDIKPANILLRQEGDGLVLKISDFGEAMVLLSGKETEFFGGTPEYMAPEKCRKEPYNHKADLWSIGLLLHEARFGYRPFQIERNESKLFWTEATVTKFQPIVPWTRNRALRDLITGLLDVDPANRISFKGFYLHSFLGRPKEKNPVADAPKKGQGSLPLPTRGPWHTGAVSAYTAVRRVLPAEFLSARIPDSDEEDEQSHDDDKSQKKGKVADGRSEKGDAGVEKAKVGHGGSKDSLDKTGTVDVAKFKCKVCMDMKAIGIKKKGCDGCHTCDGWHGENRKNATAGFPCHRVGHDKPCKKEACMLIREEQIVHYQRCDEVFGPKLLTEQTREEAGHGQNFQAGPSSKGALRSREARKDAGK